MYKVIRVNEPSVARARWHYASEVDTCIMALHKASSSRVSPTLFDEVRFLRTRFSLWQFGTPLTRWLWLQVGTACAQTSKRLGKGGCAPPCTPLLCA